MKRNFNKFTLLILSCALLGLCGCPQVPKLARPEVPVPQAWPFDPGAPAPKGSAPPPAAGMEWKKFFQDEKLRAVIELALASNRDLRMAALNIERAQAMYRIQKAAIYPTVGVAASVNGSGLPGTVTSSGDFTVEQQYSVGLGVSGWELDFFGRLRSLKSAALEQYLATEQARSATQIALVAAVANSYLSLAANRENLRIAQATLEAQQASEQIVRRIADAGMTSDLDVRQAQSQVEAAQVDIVRFNGQIALDENALSLLVGAPVPSRLLPDSLDQAGRTADVSAGLPSETLLRRPDILLAEHELKATEANILAARAAFFPRISLTAAAGLLSGDLVDLFKPGSATWAVAPSVSLPIFDKGSRKANFKAALVQREIAVAAYEKAIQEAFREVCDCLSQRTTLVKQMDAQQALVKTLQDTFRLSELRYKGGIDGYLNVLVAQRAMYTAEQSLVYTRLARLANLVTLYKVLGGGLDAAPPAAPPPGEGKSPAAPDRPESGKARGNA